MTTTKSASVLVSVTVLFPNEVELCFATEGNTLKMVLLSEESF